MEKLFGFIGVGNMGYALLKGAETVFEKEKLIYTDVNKERCQWVSKVLGIPYEDNHIPVVNQAKYLVLAVKPQYMMKVLETIQHALTQEHILISIAPGITIDAIKNCVGQTIRVVRAMPNTPAMVLEGMTALAYSEDEYHDTEKEKIQAFFSSVGEMIVINEHLMDSVVPISGSSPAYVFIFMEALADGAVRLGLTREQAYKMVAQTVLGSAKLMMETKKHPAILKDQVCSPGGTTIEAVAALEKNGLRHAVSEAVEVCYNKCIELAKGK